MTDLYLGLGVMALVMLVAMVAVQQFLEAAPKALGDLLALLTVLVMFLYIRDLWDDMRLVRWLPYSNLIVVGNWLPVGCAILAGIAWQRLPNGSVRRLGLTAGVLLIGVYAAWYPLQGKRPECRDERVSGISLQTTPATCSAAAAATLLRQHGIEANESEMAELCLTRRGTYWKGLYRGLKLKTAGTEWDVQVFKSDVEHLRQTVGDGPAILLVGIDQRTEATDVYVRDWGWVPGVSHSVVLLGFDEEGDLEIGDPAVGREVWLEDDVRLLWSGKGLRLVRRTTEVPGYLTSAELAQVR